MSRITIIASVVALLASGLAFHVGHKAAQREQSFQRRIAGLPPDDARVPQVAPSVEEQEVVTGFARNPFEGRSKSGALMPRDGEQRAAFEQSLQARSRKQSFYLAAAVIPVLLVFGLFIARARKRFHDTHESGETSCDTAEPC
ncbi:hypothetical protein GC176_26855 [bacterium]|nr:hypothetical protein [bacterium]